MSEEVSTIVLTDEEIKKIESEVKEMTKTVSPMQLAEHGNFLIQSDQDLARAMQRYKAMGVVPKQFKNEAEAAGAYVYAQSLGLQPLAAWGQIALIHGHYTVYGSLMMALAQRDPDYGYKNVIYLDADQNKICAENKNLNTPAWACVIQAQKKGSPFITESSFDMDKAKKAGLIKNVWNTYPHDMLFWKAAWRDARLNHSAYIEGVLMYEDLKDSWDSKDVSPKEDLNSL